MVKKTSEKGNAIDGCPSSSELSENKPRKNFRLGDITWVKHSGSSWWPAQVIDEACVSSKPKKKTGHDALVRLYGTCQYLYVDPWKSNTEFEMILKQENKTAMEAFHEVLQKELSHVKSPSDYDEGAVNSKAKTSSRKVRKREGLKRSGHRGIKELATAEGLGDEAEHQYIAEQDQEIGSNATTGVAVRKGRKQEGSRKSSPPHDKEQAINKTSSENSAEGLRDNKTQKQVSVVQDKKGRKMARVGTSVARREGLRRSGRTNAMEYLDAAEDSTSQLHDTSASENATEVGDITSENQNQHKNDSVVDGILGPHGEIKAMVRDILLGDIISRQHSAEMAYVDKVIYGICDATEENVAGGGTAATKGGRGVKRIGSRLEAESSNATQRPRKGKVSNLEAVNYQITKNHNSKDNDSNSSPSRDAAMEESGQRSARQIKIMQNLGLIAPSGSPFGRKGLVAATHR